MFKVEDPYRLILTMTFKLTFAVSMTFNFFFHFKEPELQQKN